jgi:hypothetical protein
MSLADGMAWEKENGWNTNVNKKEQRSYASLIRHVEETLPLIPPEELDFTKEKLKEVMDTLEELSKNKKFIL